MNPHDSFSDSLFNQSFAQQRHNIFAYINYCKQSSLNKCIIVCMSNKFLLGLEAGWKFTYIFSIHACVYLTIIKSV